MSSDLIPPPLSAAVDSAINLKEQLGSTQLARDSVSPIVSLTTSPLPSEAVPRSKSLDFSSFDEGITTTVGGIPVNSTLVPIAQAIFDKYGDITSGVTQKSVLSKMDILNQICRIVAHLQKSQIGSLHGLSEMIQGASDFAILGYKVDWLINHLLRLNEATIAISQVQFLRSSESSIDEAIAGWEKRLTQNEEKVNSLKEELLKAEASLVDSQKQLHEYRQKKLEIVGQLGALEEMATSYEQVSLVHDLL